ncbi:hypothetical protein NPIL_26021 [Nephila pilipes]|uniref:Uncharacterized protein n=1 Tax=Nephila pilipes TaxID=299642 RepID=A0A8X6UT63_NEPPI|nr:hypothetical protein NPIL_26021 [Nephila pilipes]
MTEYSGFATCKSIHDCLESDEDEDGYEVLMKGEFIFSVIDKDPCDDKERRSDDAIAENGPPSGKLFFYSFGRL